MPSQRCPNCGTEHDVSIYVSGQRVLCECGIHFDVTRQDASGVNIRVDKKPTSDAPLDTPEVSAPPVPGHTPPPAPGGPAESEATFVARPVHIPGYEMVELLGRGGMGEVWRARQLSLSRYVAIKILARNLSADGEFIARFDKEASALAALSHPNIVQIIDRGVAEGTFYFAMELVEGRSLREMIGANRMPPDEALRIVAQICRAMDYAHERGVVHRDLKPENILVDGQGNVKVADFGLAAMARADPRLNVTRASTAMGTLHYMAPEQRRDAHAVDGRADVYSVGVILYELLTGEVPMGRFKLPSARVTGVDGRVDAIIEKALEPEPAARYARASLVIRDIEGLITTQQWVTSKKSRDSVRLEDSEEIPRPERGRLSRRRRRRQFTLGFVLLGVVIGVLATRAWLRAHGQLGPVKPPPNAVPPDTHRDRPVLAAVTQEGELASIRIDSFSDGPEDGPAVLSLHSGQWDYRAGDLFARAYVPPGSPALRYTPSAYLERPRLSLHRGLDVEVTAVVDTRPPWHGFRADADVELFFRTMGAELGLHAVFPAVADDGTYYRAAWRYIDSRGNKHEGDAKDTDMEDDEDIHPPQAGRAFRMRLKINDDNVVEGFAGDSRFFIQKLPGITGFDGRIGVECRNAICRFSGLRASGKLLMNEPRAPLDHHEEARLSNE